MDKQDLDIVKTLIVYSKQEIYKELEEKLGEIEKLKEDVKFLKKGRTEQREKIKKLEKKLSNIEKKTNV